MKSIPCRNCITLPICLSLYRENKIAEQSILIMSRKCILIEKIVFNAMRISNEWVDTGLDEDTRQKNVKLIIDFFDSKTGSRKFRSDLRWRTFIDH